MIEAKRRSGLTEADPMMAFNARPVLVSYGVRWTQPRSRSMARVTSGKGALPDEIFVSRKRQSQRAQR